MQDVRISLGLALSAFPLGSATLYSSFAGSDFLLYWFQCLAGFPKVVAVIALLTGLDFDCPYSSQCKKFSSVQFSSVAQSCPTLCDPMNHSTPGLSVHHQLPEFTQTHVHRVGDAIQPSHPLPVPSPPAPNPSQHQSLFR